VTAGTLDLRTMTIICPGPIGWLGAWGYMASLVWLPYAGWRAVRARRSGMGFAMHDAIPLLVVAVQIVAVQVLLRSTPLKYGYPLF
jgi:hypothetical protein